MLGKWLRLRREGAPLPLGRIFGMYLRRTLTDDVVKAIVLNQKHDLAFELDTIEAHALCSGHIGDVAEVLSKAKEQGLEMDPMLLLALDLIGEAPDKIFDEFVRDHAADPNLSFAQVAGRYLASPNP